jgi:hypothetical protein
MSRPKTVIWDDHKIGLYVPMIDSPKINSKNASQTAKSERSHLKQRTKVKQNNAQDQY